MNRPPVPAEIPVSSARKKMWWQDQSDYVKPYVIDRRRDPCDCSQDFELAQTGCSDSQGPTHYCPGCRWAFWPITIKPTASQLKEIQKTNPSATVDNMTYVKLCNKPPLKWGATHKNIMIDQLGGGKFSPYFLTAELKEYWLDLYCKKYPSTAIAKHRKKLQEARENKTTY